MPLNPYSKYKEQSVMTMTPGEMLIRLYDEAIKQLSGAVLYIGEKSYGKANTAMQKTQKILSYLTSTLNFKYDIANNLEALYDYFNYQIVNANIHKDAKLIEEIIPMITGLRDAFAQADRLSKNK